MAKVKKGIFDAPSGKVGNVVYSHRNGVAYVRTRPGQYRDAKTDAQLAAREKLNLITNLMSDLKPILRIGFPDVPPGKSSRDVAYRANAKTAITGSWPNLSIDYPAVVVSMGPLAPAPEAGVSRSGNTLTCTWPEPSGPATGSRRPDDRALLIVCDPASGQVIFDVFAGRRSDGKAAITLPADFASAETLHTWLSFVSYDGESVSNSMYAVL